MSKKKHSFVLNGSPELNGKDNIKDKVLKVINKVRVHELKKGFYPVTVYTNGDCGNLFFILKESFPKAVPYLITDREDKHSHIVTGINGKYYDIRGEYLMPSDKRCQCKRADWRDLKENSFNFNIKYHCKGRAEEKAKHPDNVKLKILKDDIKDALSHNPSDNNNKGLLKLLHAMLV